MNIEAIKSAGDYVGHWRTFSKYLVSSPNMGYYAISEIRGVILGPAADGESIDHLISNFHLNKRRDPETP